jgi:hypothetical protein
MKRFSFIFLFIVSLLNCSVVYAAEQICDESTLGIVAKHLKLKDFYLYDYKTDNGLIVSSACKVAPQVNNIELVAIAYDSEGSVTKPAKVDTDAMLKRNVIVAMIDNPTKRIISNYQSIITEDAAVQVGDNSFQLDTAAYQLAPNVRAFGLRFNNAARGPSCPDGWQGGELQLLVRDSASLRPVFAIPMNHLLVSKGCINAGTGMDTLYEKAKLTVKVLKSRTNGYADLDA